jgi:hypothetical protein
MCHLALLHYSGGHPVPRAASLYDGNKQIYANILACLGLFPLLLPIFTLFKQPNSRLFAIVVLLRILVEYSLRREISIPVILDPGIRAPEVSRCELFPLVSLNFVYDVGAMYTD